MFKTYFDAKTTTADDEESITSFEEENPILEDGGLRMNGLQATYPTTKDRVSTKRPFKNTVPLFMSKINLRCTTPI